MQITDSKTENRRIITTDDADFSFETDFGFGTDMYMTAVANAFIELTDKLTDAIVNSPFGNTALKVAGCDWLYFTYVPNKDVYTVLRPGTVSHIRRAGDLDEEIMTQRIYFRTEKDNI